MRIIPYSLDMDYSFAFKSSLEYVKNQLTAFEERTDSYILLGGIIGSNSQFLHRSDSDVDLRFLYVSKSLNFLPSQNRHQESLIRCLIKNKPHVCNTIALWEASAL